MKIDGRLSGSLARAAEQAGRAEASGYDGAISAEVNHDPFLPLALAAANTSTIRLATGIAVAFARNPMTVAQTAHDLHRLSGGRLALGLGSQVKAHVTRRFSMPWSQPADRMREFVLAVRAIWSCWEDGVPLRFEGQFYRHTLMTPAFSPEPTGLAPPKILLAAVGPAMTQVAGEVADGVVIHAFSTADYLREVTLAHLDRALRAAGRSRGDLEVCLPAFVVTGRDEAEFEAARRAARERIAFYASTPAYLPVLEHHGWGDLGRELTGLSKAGQWSQMGALVDDDVLNAFAVVGPATTVARQLMDRYGPLVDRLEIGIGGDGPGALDLIDGLRRRIPAATSALPGPAR
jgi:probable F420-dependent oxidoreductase